MTVINLRTAKINGLHKSIAQQSVEDEDEDKVEDRDEN